MTTKGKRADNYDTTHVQGKNLAPMGGMKKVRQPTDLGAVPKRSRSSRHFTATANDPTAADGGWGGGGGRGVPAKGGGTTIGKLKEHSGSSRHIRQGNLRNPT